MKLHLPSALRKALLAVSVVSMTVAGTTQAAIMHPSVSLQTYTDFGSNMGRYTIYQQNELLQHLNSKGVYISYTQGQNDYKLEHGMISYESMVDGGPFTAISYNATATVQHNGVTNPVFTGRFIGSDQAIHYAGIEYRSCENNTFLLTPQIDYKVTRISKVITDITPSTLYDAKTHMQKGDNINDMLQYRAGGGYMQQADETGKTTWLTGAYTYVVGGIVDNWSFGYSSGYDYKTGTPAKWDGRNMPDDSYTLSIQGVIDFKPEHAGTASHPLPFVTQGGDSGSPVWVWDTYSNSYQLISCHQARGSYDSYSRGASEWTKATLKSFCVDVDMDKAGHTVHIGEIREVEGKSKTYEALANGSTHASTTTKIGSVYSENGAVDEDFIGIEHGKNTWLNLYDLKDGQKTDASGTTKNVNWYAYGNEYLNATNTATSDIQYADLFMTENLVFSSSATSNDIILDADVDLGIGYAQFSKTSESGKAEFTITGHDDAGNRDYNFNHAGYIIDKDVDVHLKIANREVESETGKDYFREWRKTGEGDLYLEGTGDNHIFLNVGGKGTTFLKEQNGYAAYNVLINNGATVNLGGNINQVERDVTFGYGGGVLDFYGTTQMDWRITSPGAQQGAGFTISALTQDAIIANTASGTTTTLTYKADKDTTFLGSFWDGTIKDENGQYIHQQNAGTLKVVYAGEANTTWTLNSIHTKLSGQSGLEVKNGTVVLVGTNTVHAQGSLNGYNQQRYSNEDDWHYADAAMNVTVNSGATFELGSHARLKGTVTVEGGGIFQMDEGVRHQKEYIEGWYELEDTCTAEMRQFYGLHGDVNLKEANSQMVVKFSDGTDANTTVTGKIYGNGGMTVDTAGGSLTLSGANTFEGTKTVTNGLLILDSKEAAGNTANNQWKLQDKAQLAVNGAPAAEALKLVDNTSSGVLVLTGDETDAPINMQGYNSLIIGAEAGKKIQFGTENSQEKFRAVEGKWNLGGGGGNLVVNYQLLDESATLVLGNPYTTGSVTLTNTHNKIGAIDFAGKVTLSYADSDALGDADINLSYTNRIMGAWDTVSLINEESDGVMLLNNMANATIDLRERKSLHLGADGHVEYGGEIKLGVEEYDDDWNEGVVHSSTYYFGGITGHLKLTKALVDQNQLHTNLVVDGQTYSGGVLELQNALDITGYVSIAGYKPYSTFTGGDITLKVDAENAFANIQEFYLYEGGTLDINGHDQTLNSYMVEAGSAIIDSSANKSGVLTLKGEWWNSFDGSLDVGSLVIDAGGFLYMGGDSAYRNLEIKRGNVYISSSTALSATGRTVLEEYASLFISNVTVTANLELKDSTVTLGDAEATAKPVGHLAGTLTVADGTTGTVNFAVNGSTLSAVVNTGKEGRLRLTGNRGTVSSSLINADGSEEGASDGQTSGGNVDVELNELRLQSGSSIAIGGTLNLKGPGNKLILSSWGSANNMERDISHMNVEKGLALTIQEDSWNTIWNIHKLTGEGNITWNSKTQHWFSSRIVLDGSNDFEGTFKAERTAADSAGRLYGSFVELAHDEALQKATLEMLGKEAGKETDSARSMMTLALNTDNAKLLGLKGNELTAIYAGASIEGESKTGAPLKTAPYSVRNATLTITGNEDYEFKGKVFGAAEGDKSGAGVDLVMAGTRTQKFSGETVQFNNVTVQSGTLELSSTGLDLADRATIHRGATLKMTDSVFNLVEGTTLMVAGDNLQQQATLNATLKLDSGVLGFDGRAISTGSDSYALSTLGLDKGEQETLDVLFESTFALQTGEYKLASGDGWTSITNDNYHALGLDYYKAEFSANESGLSVTLSLKENSAVWAGNSQKNIWSTTDFGTATEVPGENDTVVFNNMAESKNVQVDGAQKAGRLLFDSTEAYTVKGTADSSLQAGSLRQTGSGTTTLDSGINITGLAEIKAGTLVLEEGSQVHDASVAADAALHLKSAHALTDTVEGDGVVKVAWNAGATGSVKLGEKGIGAMVVESGTLEVTEAVNVQRQLVVTKSGTLRSSTGNILKQEDMPLELGGKLVIDHSGNTELKLATTITGEGDKLGAIEKTGTGRLTITSSVAADSLTVNQGSVYITEDAYLADFLANTKNLVVKNGRAELGGNAFTHNTDGYATNLSIDGSDAILHLALGQSSTKTFQGGLSVKNGGKLELHDGGLQINGDICLGTGASDRVTLWGNWGEANNVNKAGIILAGEVSGEGTVALQKGGNGNMERFTLSNEKNSFAGTFEVNSKTSLVAAADTALAQASVNIKADGGLLIATQNAQIRNLSGVDGGFVKLDNSFDSGTLAVNQTIEGEYAGSIGSNLSLTKTGGAKLSLSGDNSAFSGTLDLQQGILSLNAAQFGTSSEGFDMTLNGGTLRLEGGSLNMGQGSLGIQQNTTLDVESLEHFSYSSYQDGEFDKENGYAAGNLVLISAGSISDGALSHLTGSGLLENKTLLLQDHNIVVQGTAPSTLDYHVNTNVSYGTGEGNTAYEQAKSIVLRLADAKLELNSNLNQAVCSGGIVAQAKGATINIGQDVTLNAASLHDDNTVYLDGKGTYQLEVKTNSQNIDTTLGNANRVELAEGWTGTVKLQGAGGDKSHLMLENYGHTGSNIMLTGTSGWLSNGAKIAANLLLEPASGTDALTISNGSSDGVEYFQGAISGSGSINRTWSGGKLAFHFSGDVSEWTGSIKTSNGSLALYFYGDATDMGAAISTEPGKTTDIYVGEKASAPADATFRQAVTATSLNLFGASSATLNAATSLSSVSGEAGTLAVEAETNVTGTVALAGLKLGEEGVLKVGNDQSGLAIFAQNGEASINAAISLDAANNSHSITGADDARIENTLIDLAAGTRLEMANVVLASSSSITDAAATLVANGLVVEADKKTNLEEGERYNSVAGALTPLTYGATATPEEAPAGQIACFTLSNIQDVAIEGTGLVVSLTGDSSQMLGGADWLRLSLGNEGKFTEGLDVTLLYEDAAGQQRSTQGVYTLEDVEAQAAAEAAAMNHDYVYFRITANVPEPATGTLSLLALAALAARRRRK